jgi:hypothetical protein
LHSHWSQTILSPSKVQKNPAHLKSMAPWQDSGCLAQTRMAGRTLKFFYRGATVRICLTVRKTILSRFVVTPRVAKHRYFSWLPASVSPDSRLLVVARADDLTFGILSSRIHEVWSLAQASMHGVGNDPTYNAKSCFETFPFPTGLTPADTAHQQTEQVEGGALIPALVACADGLRVEPAMTIPLPATAIPLPAMTSHRSLLQLRAAAIQIATAAKKLNDLREAWLNPREWTHNVPEVTPLGMSESPYPDRIEPKPGISPDDLKALQKRTLTNLYNLRPQWLVMAHQQLDLAVAQAYGWSDYCADTADEEILKRLLALNLARSGDAGSDVFDCWH